MHVHPHASAAAAPRPTSTTLAPANLVSPSPLTSDPPPTSDPQVRAMQIIDELEVNRRGPYGGGLGHVGFTGSMDMALALRTMVIQTAARDTLYSYNGPDSRREWAVHIQARAGAGLVADSVPELEYEETINKAAALGRAVDLAEQAFVSAQGH
ncbi:anthranilate synthase component I [Monoraphidium neglectum]|uniref:Anthranilate synthase component I n=1 Tax=Monoraphidium neglectum TaxID=145388 RepID=A0A0D2LHC2_9CHLO|nr:anthranilate synthase component I [Monoraphidium neglectum]KIZ05899.1 anthranilate synthase component I [Monoraphidium neglectum]|eukprot:XP_013904918.1 anthranilate synthase component I [Monoraphidium neglectum]